MRGGRMGCVPGRGNSLFAGSEDGETDKLRKTQLLCQTAPEAMETVLVSGLFRYGAICPAFYHEGSFPPLISRLTQA